MDEFIILLILTFLIIVLIIFLIGCFIYKLLKLLNLPRLAILATVVYGLFIIYFSLLTFYEDELFSKNDAIELVKDLDFNLNDDFKLTENVSDWGIGDYYYTFTLEISDNDKNRLINEIKSSPNFMNDSIYSRTNIIYPDRHKGKKTVWNYEDKHSYNRQYFQPKRRKLYQLSLVLNFFKIYVLRFVNKERLEHS